MLEKGCIGQVYVIGGDNEISNLELVKTLCEKLDKKVPRSQGSYLDLITYVKDRPGHDLRYAVDSSKIKKDLNWRPKININDGVERTIDWYLENETWWREIMKTFNISKRVGEIR